MKIWEKPRLIILVRRKPEEMLLQGCKYYLPPEIPGPGSVAGGCSWQCAATCDLMVPS